MRDYQTKANQSGLPDSITAEKFGAGEANSTLTESKTAVSSSGQTLAPADGTGEITDQLARALAIYGGGGAEYMVDTGAANAYVLNPVFPKKAASAYFDGMTVSFKPGNLNTGASTVNVASIGVKSVTDIGGNALIGGEISSFVTLRYNLASDRFESIHLGTLNAGSPGYVIFENGLIAQWATVGSGSTAAVFPITFPNAVFEVFIVVEQNSVTNVIGNTFFVSSKTTTGFSRAASGIQAIYLAIGY